MRASAGTVFSFGVSVCSSDAPSPASSIGSAGR
jgi:hypothetical protein